MEHTSWRHYTMAFAFVLPMVVAVVFTAFDAQAITISGGKIDKGAVQVKGKDAAPLALITWEGQPVGQASNRGSFRLATAILPEDCIGELSDGVDTIDVVIAGCAELVDHVRDGVGHHGWRGRHDTDPLQVRNEVLRPSWW